MSRILAITPGEPAGIGPDLVVELAQHQRENDWLVVADPELLQARAQILGLPLTIQSFHGVMPGRVKQDAICRGGGELTVLPVRLNKAVVPGRLEKSNAAYVLATLDAAITGCLDGDFAALVTGPVQKSLINEAGFRFTGHTEYLARACGVEKVVMLLVAPQLVPPLRVALVTTHLPLARVAEYITRQNLKISLDILLSSLEQQFALSAPRILVAGLNPHAGESGHLGREEIDVIAPVCQQLRDAGADVRGPLPADTLFTQPWLDEADAVLAMYHDQGLPVLKTLAFGTAVNVTLGLPIVRTSVDHGTALDLAGKKSSDPDKASNASLKAAIDLAMQLSLQRSTHPARQVQEQSDPASASHPDV